jgi:predicted HTH transcriptional regulator
MTGSIDLDMLSRRESEQIEWKENVADIDDVVRTLSAFANDLANLGGGYVVCGAVEVKDEHGFPRLVRTGLTSSRLQEIKGKVLNRCRERVFPSIMPLVEELPADTDERRILVFIQPRTSQAHAFRHDGEGSKHYIRDNRSTIEARNGLLRELLVRKGALEPWDRRPCGGATVDDLDLLVLRDVLQQMRAYSSDQGIDQFLSEHTMLNAFVPPLCARDPLTGVLRPRNFTMLLFGRNTQLFIPGAVSLFSVYPGTDRSDSHAERHEMGGNLIEQIRRVKELLNVQAYTAYDTNRLRPPESLCLPTGSSSYRPAHCQREPTQSRSERVARDQSGGTNHWHGSSLGCKLRRQKGKVFRQYFG